MSKWSRVQGDTNDTLVAQLAGVADLTGVTAIEAHVWPAQSIGAAVTLAAVVTNAASRTVTVNLGSWISTAGPGRYQLEIQTTWGGGPIITWPEGAPDELTIRAQGA